MEFVLVAPLLLVLALAVLQVALLLHARATLASAAAEGARAAALSGSDPNAGVARTRMVVDRTLGGAVVEKVAARREVLDGLPVITVRISAAVPLIGLLGPTTLEVEAHALIESAR